jgi:hypothetical protein
MSKAWILCWKTLALLASVLGLAGMVQAQQAGQVRRLDAYWQMYDEASGLYVSYLPAYETQAKRLHLLLDWQAVGRYYLVLEAPGATHLFANNRLVESLPGTAQPFSLPLERLERYAGVGGELLITLYAPNGFPSPPGALLSRRPAQRNLSEGRHEYRTAIPLAGRERQQALAIMGVGVLAVFAAFYRIPNPIFNLDYLRRYLAGFTKIKSEGGRINTVSFFLFNIFYAITLAYLMVVVAAGGEGLSEPAIMRRGLSLFGWVLAFLGGKIALLWILSLLYDYRKAMNIHVQEFMNVNQIYCMAMLLAVGTLYFSNILQDGFWRGMAFYALWASLLLTGALVSYRINKTLPFRKVYLFSYLCGTEFFPALVLIKLLAS